MTRKTCKRICKILMICGAAGIFLSTTMGATLTALRICAMVGAVGCALLMIGTVGLRRIEQRELREERVAARRRSLRLLLQQEEERHHASM
jgi:hypothetical protein